jgi:hypothetical protein
MGLILPTGERIYIKKQFKETLAQQCGVDWHYTVFTPFENFFSLHRLFQRVKNGCVLR